MSKPKGRNAATEEDVKQLLEDYPPEVRELALKVRELVREIVPDAVEEIDWSAKMLGYNFIPGTYKGLILTISPQKSYVNIILAHGAEMAQEGIDDGLLEGTGKLARHIKVRNEEILNNPTTRRLIETAVERTPRE
jgi:hypothetical protein